MESPKKRQAREAMEGAFIQLLSKKSIEQISITELCRKAGVNRSTFYAHYLDIYDLMEQVSNRFVRNMFQDMIGDIGEPNVGQSSENPHPLILRALETTLANRELCRLLVLPNPSISYKLIEQVLDWCRERYEVFSNRNNPGYAAEYTMTIGGTVVLWYDWIRSDFAVTPDQIAREITCFVEGNIRRIWS